jgi:catechol 2,3-dioxygenase
MTSNRSIGHVVLNVASLERSVPFYRDALGLREVARLGAREREIVGADMVFFSFGANHHDVALREVPGAVMPGTETVGLVHVAIRIGTHIDELVALADHLRTLGVDLVRTRDHKVSQSLYIKDPDGIEVELYVDADPAIWAANPSAVATVDPLTIGIAPARS